MNDIIGDLGGKSVHWEVLCGDVTSLAELQDSAA
jgi:hypothetical protein